MSLSFDDASSQYLDRAGVPVTAPPFTMACWFQTDDNAIDQTLMALNNNGVETDYHSLSLRSQNVRAQTFGDSLTEAGGGFGVSNNTWYFAVGRWTADDDRQVQLFDVAGTLINSRSDTTSKAVAGLNTTSVGRLSTLTPGKYHSGLIAERAIFSGALTDAQVAELALSLSPLSSAASLLDYTPLYGSTNPARDWAQGNDLTFNNTPTAATHVPLVVAPGKANVPPPYGKETLNAVAMSGCGQLEVAFAGTPIQSIAMSGCGALNIGSTELFLPIANPTLAGDLVDVSNNSVFQLTVNGSLLDFNADKFDVEDLTVGYNGKQLSFFEITCIDSQTFFNEAEVTLDLDFTGGGSALERVFTGRIRQVEYVGQNNLEAVRYTAQGNQQIANEVTLVNTDSRPNVEFTVITSSSSATTPTVTNVTLQIKDAIQDLFEINASRLNTFGIPATIGFPGLEQFTANLPETVEFTNVGFTQAIAQLAAFQPGVKVLWDDKTLKWTFPNLQTVPTAKIQVNSMNVVGLPLTFDTDDRYTALKLYANIDDILDDAILNKPTEGITIGGTSGFLERTTVSLEPFWLPELEPDWTLLKAFGGNPFTLETENFWVYKRWKLPDELEPEWPGAPVSVMQQVNNWGVVGWQKLHGRTIFSRRLFIARFHAIHRGNPMVPGDVIGPLAVSLAYYPRNFNFSIPTSINSAGMGVTFVGTTINQEDVRDELRVPAVGFEGTAFDKFGVERELVQMADRSELTQVNAQAILDGYKDVIISGDIEIDGDPLPELIHLGKKVVAQHDVRLTNIDSLPALCTEYRYRFGKRGRSTLSLSTDVAGLIRTQ